MRKLTYHRSIVEISIIIKLREERRRDEKKWRVA